MLELIKSGLDTGRDDQTRSSDPEQKRSRFDDGEHRCRRKSIGRLSRQRIRVNTGLSIRHRLSRSKQAGSQPRERLMNVDGKCARLLQCCKVTTDGHFSPSGDGEHSRDPFARRVDDFFGEQCE
jgi:hypothetical protein